MGVRHVNIALDESEYTILASAKEVAERKSGSEMSWPEFIILMANDTSAKWRK